MAERIQCLKSSLLNTEDSYTWIPLKTGTYTMKSCYYSIMSSNHDTRRPIIIGKFKWHIDIWTGGFSPKLKVFMWSCIHKAPPVGENLRRRGIADVGCLRSGEYESTEHMLFSCPFAIQVWNQVPILNTTHIAAFIDKGISSKI